MATCGVALWLRHCQCQTADDDCRAKFSSRSLMADPCTPVHTLQTEKGADGTPTLKWGSKAQDIYCVVMGRRQKWFSNQLACIMWVKPGTAVRTAPCHTHRTPALLDGLGPRAAPCDGQMPRAPRALVDLVPNQRRGAASPSGNARGGALLRQTPARVAMVCAFPRSERRRACIGCRTNSHGYPSQ